MNLFVHLQSTRKARDFIGSGVPAMLPRDKATAIYIVLLYFILFLRRMGEGPSQCSAQITTQWQQEKVVLLEALR